MADQIIEHHSLERADLIVLKSGASWNYMQEICSRLNGAMIEASSGSKPACLMKKFPDTNQEMAQIDPSAPLPSSISCDCAEKFGFMEVMVLLIFIAVFIIIVLLLRQWYSADKRPVGTVIELE